MKMNKILRRRKIRRRGRRRRRRTNRSNTKRTEEEMNRYTSRRGVKFSMHVGPLGDG